MKIAGMIILYNPSEEVKKNIETYIDYIDKLYVVDNSNVDNSGFIDNEKVEYFSNKKNKGVAFALNKGAKMAIKDKYEYLLTMDQDSKFTYKNLDRMIHYLDKHKDIALLSPWHDLGLDIPKPSDAVDYPQTVMTSGNIINLKAYKKVKGFNNDLFIDCVDFDYCLKLLQKDYKIVRLNKSILKHNLGRIKKDKVLFKEVTHSNHNYIRRYYMTRNGLYINQKYGNEYPESCKYVVSEIKKDALKIVLLEKNKIEKLKSMYQGYKDFKNEKYGKYEV